MVHDMWHIIYYILYIVYRILYIVYIMLYYTILYIYICRPYTTYYPVWLCSCPDPAPTPPPREPRCNRPASIPASPPQRRKNPPVFGWLTSGIWLEYGWNLAGIWLEYGDFWEFPAETGWKTKSKTGSENDALLLLHEMKVNMSGTNRKTNKDMGLTTQLDFDF